jgi:hypothetical protein
LKSTLIKILKFLGFLFLGVLLLYFAFRDIKFENLKDDFQNARYSWIILSLVFAVFAYISRAARWNLIIEPLNYKPSLANTFYSLMLGYLANFAFPRIGEVTRCATLSRKEKIPLDKLFGTVIVERVLDFLTLLTVLFLLIIFRFETFGNFFSESVFTPLGNKISNTLNFSRYIWIGLGILLLTAVIFYFVFRDFLSRIKMIAKAKNAVKGIIEGLKTVYRMKRRRMFLFHTLFIWVNYLMMTWVAVFALPSTSSLGIIDGLFILVIGGLGMSAPVQSGIGAYHWIISRGLVAVYPFISLEQGLVFATISHESQSLLAILLGFFSFVMLFRRKKSAFNDSPSPLESAGESVKTQSV